MSDKDHLRRLITNHNRRLRVLKERQALQGQSADPGLQLEIEDIEEKISELQEELEQLEQPAKAIARTSARLSDITETKFRARNEKKEEILAFIAAIPGA